MWRNVLQCAKKWRKVLVVSRKSCTFADDILTRPLGGRINQPFRDMNETIRKEERTVEVLTFRKGSRAATVVTDGEHTRAFEWEGSRSFETLKRAIAYLESEGYTIDMEDVTW